MNTYRKIPLLKNRSNDKTVEPWFELTTNKESFQKILHVLARYYRQFDTGKAVSESQQFRDDLIRKPVDSFRVFLKRFSANEYLIYAEIREGENIRSDYWIHIDGIQEERAEQNLAGNEEHPVFSIVCVTDLYENNCSSVQEDMEEYLQK